jgi:hypothetical protein
VSSLSLFSLLSIEIFSIVNVRCNVIRTIELFFDKSDPTGVDRDEHRMSIEASLKKEERCEGMNITTEILLDSDQKEKRRFIDDL